jgi:hypothetical protein
MTTCDFGWWSLCGCFEGFCLGETVFIILIVSVVVVGCLFWSMYK